MKRTLYWLIPLAILILLIALFPSLASTPLGKPILIKALETRLDGTVTIEQVSLSWFGPQKFKSISFSNADVEAQVDTVESNVPLWALSDLGETFHLQNGSFSFPSYGGGKIVSVNAKIEGSEINATGSTTQGGHLSLKGKIYADDDFDVVADMKSVPAGALDQVLKAKGFLYQVLGHTVDINGTVVYNRGEGAVSLNLSSTNAQTALNAALSEHTLTLKEPLTLTLKLTRELGTALMSRVNPLFLTSVEAQHPIILRVSPKNFSFPLNPFSLEKFRVGSATLDMGQVRGQPGKSLQSMLKLLKSSRSGGTINMWFTPLAFQIENGIVQTGRMDALLAESIHLCTWGNIDLVRDQLQMYLGLPSDTLAQAFGLQNLPRNYVLKIPITGSTKDPEIDTSSATSKITAMIAAQQLPKVGGQIGGNPGKVFGGLLNLITQPKEDEDVPPPNRPFPWEK